MKKLELLGEYFAHILMGIGFFVILALASLLISVVTHWVGGFEAGKHLVPFLGFIESLLLVADCVFVSWWVLFSTWKACKELRG